MVNAVFSGSGAANVTSLTSSALSSLSKTGFIGAPVAGRSSTCSAELPRHGRREPQHHRTHGQARRIRALALATELGAEGLAHLVAVALLDAGDAPADCPPQRCPCPRPGAPRRRPAAGAGTPRAAFARHASRRCGAPSAARRGPGPLTTTTGSRSPIPSTSHHAFAATVAASAGPVSVSRKCWSSSICAPSQGCVETIAGPPVAKLHSVASGQRLRSARRRTEGLPLCPDLHGTAHAGRQRLAKVVQPAPVVDPATRARGRRCRRTAR